jgi:hypothetical protein
MALNINREMVFYTNNSQVMQQEKNVGRGVFYAVRTEAA